MSRIRQIISCFVVILLVAAGSAQIPARAQDVGARLSASTLGDIDPGQYQAGDRVNFLLTDEGERYLLKFANEDEIFVLTAGRGSMGGRILKYDSGDTVAQVAGWGALTLYTDDAPNGLPAVRLGEGPRLIPQIVPLIEVQEAAQETGEKLDVIVVADWMAVAVDPMARAMGLETLQNIELGIERFIKERGREAFTDRVDTIRLQPGIRPSLLLTGKTLMVGYNQGQSFAGRMSSHAVAQTLNGLIAR